VLQHPLYFDLCPCDNDMIPILKQQGSHFTVWCNVAQLCAWGDADGVTACPTVDNEPQTISGIVLKVVHSLYRATFFLASASDVGGWSAACTGCFTPRGRATPYPLSTKQGGSHSLSVHFGEEKNLLLLMGIKP
jgi:hypothetical protein